MTTNVPTFQVSGYNEVLNPQPKLAVLRPGDRLESWKEIALYLNRSVRTVRRWEENEGLPVHRQQHDKRGSVFAYRGEIDVWRDARIRLLEAEDAATAVPGPISTRNRWWAAGLALFCILAAAGYWAVRQTRASAAEYKPNPEAVRAVQRANFGGNPGRAQVQAGIKYYQEAIRLDPRFAQAWGGLATAHIALTWFGDSPARETMAQARREAEQARALNGSLSGPWRVLAYASHYLDYDHVTAEKEFRKALELNPRDAIAASWFCEFLNDLRRYDEGLAYAKQAQDLAPRWLEPIEAAGNIHLFRGDPDLAIAEYLRALEIEPAYGFANHFLGRAYLAQGQTAKAIEQLRKSNELLGQIPFSLADLGYALARGGQRPEAEKILTDMLRRRDAGYYPAFAIGELKLGLGKPEEALDWMEKAADEGNVGIYFPSTDSLYSSLRDRPRFHALMKRIHVEF